MTDSERPVTNPPRNSLTAGLPIEKIEAAIAKSGYPLQTHVANELRSLHFDVSPEWSFIDRDTGELRSMDMRAGMRLHEYDRGTRSRPELDLLIECKQSDMPFVFFTGEQMPRNANLPFLAGMKKSKFKIHSDDTQSTWSCDLQDALSLRQSAFFSTPPVAYSMAKCHRKGADIILSGDEVYNGLVLPLTKSLHHMTVSEKPPATAVYFDIHYVVALAVLDAPMISFENGVAKLTPWVRVLRHEAGDTELGKNDRGLNLSVDMVHRDFLKDYVESHLLPAAQDFSRKVLAHNLEIAEGDGFISGMESNWYTDYEPHLKPVPRVSSVGRAGKQNAAK
jgi:hypothetical protein